jgi:hypothetical protein
MSNIDWANDKAFVRVYVGGERFEYVSTVKTFRPMHAVVDAAPIYNIATGHRLIDGDGEQFKYVLDYLRDGKLDLPTNFNEHSRLRNEADRYKLDGLVNLIDKGK